ncbi:MAG: hypothetical protein JRI23_12955 [Deltaproteobacteria bacterium]|nr:hypothetical protein [Deltaproteobacteria bacterium]MBW2532627.1 hypothetical protein [Deltaproteobacteria bacterium]
MAHRRLSFRSLAAATARTLGRLLRALLVFGAALGPAAPPPPDPPVKVEEEDDDGEALDQR